jgi:hypothetical protein
MQLNAFQTIARRLLLIGLLCASGPAVFSQATALPDPIRSGDSSPDVRFVGY